MNKVLEGMQILIIPLFPPLASSASGHELDLSSASGYFGLFFYALAGVCVYLSIEYFKRYYLVNE